MLYLIGLGLGDPSDVSLKGLEIIKKCDQVYLEAYTSIFCGGQDDLEKVYGRPVKIADREFVEGDDTIKEILAIAATKDVAFLVVGHPLEATTHMDLISRAREEEVSVKVIGSQSIKNAVLECGLFSYVFGSTISIPLWTESWQPDSFYDGLLTNFKNNHHTVCLLDIKVKEPTLESLVKKKREYMPPRFMTVAEASQQLISIIKKREDSNQESDLTENNLAVGFARMGSDDQQIIVCSLKEMSSVDLGPPLHCLVIPGKDLHPMEINNLKYYASNKNEFDDLIVYK